MTAPDTVTLSFPRDTRYYSVARLVVGGMASPLQMSFDALDDIQQAISSLLDSDDLPVTGNVTLRLTVGDQYLEAEIGSFATGSVDAAFERSHELGGDFDLRRILGSIVDDLRVVAEGDGERVVLVKHVKALA